MLHRIAVGAALHTGIPARTRRVRRPVRISLV